MSYLLNIETATKNCSVSLAQNGEVIALREIAEQGYSHAEKLHVFIEQVIAEGKITIQDLDAVAVSKGPGSYTGLRIGVSAAKGLCYAINKPLISVDTLLLLAKQVQITDGLLIPMLDARRMEVYSAIYDSNYQLIRETQAQIIDAISFSEYPLTKYFFGDGAQKCQPFLTDASFVFLENKNYPSATEMASISHQKFQNQQIENLAYFEPFYLKEFVLQNTKK